MKTLKKPSIGVLLLTTPRFRNLGEGTEHGCFYKRKEKAASRLLSHMDFARVIFPGVVYTREELKNAMELFSAEQPDMIFAMFLSWSDDFAWIRFLRDMPPIPLLFATIVEEAAGFSDSFTEDRFVDFLAAGGLVGSLEASGSAGRFRRPMMRTVIGSLSHVMEETRHFSRAAAMRRQLRQTAFGLLPSYNEVMWATYVDPYALFMNAGPELHFLSVSALEDEISALSDDEVQAAAASILEQYPNDGTIQMDKMLASVAASLAMEHLARKSGVELLVLNDVDTALLTRIGLRPGFSPCPGTDDVMVVPEGDIGGGMACYILNRLSGCHVNFIEPFYINRSDDTFTVGHAGPHDYTNPGGKTIISLDTRFAKSSYRYAGAPFAWHVISPGEKTMVHISQHNGSFKMAAAVVDALECSHFLAGYSHGILQSRIPAEEFFDKLLNYGVTQHYALANGNWLKELSMTAELLGFEYLEI